MKILFFTSSVEDYLSDAILHGLRSIYGSDCVDYPKCEPLYKDCSPTILNQVRGKGFTLYSGLLDDIDVDRFHIAQKIKSGYFDLIVIGDIHRQYGWFLHFRPWLNSGNTIIIDGTDTTQPYPAKGLWWRRSYYWFLPKAHKQFLYFKREWTKDTHFYIWMRLLPGFIRRQWPQPANLRRISFSFPKEKIITKLPLKVKQFGNHIVDAEVASMVPGAKISYAFDSEKRYYFDLQQSQYGITTKRSGWDCLRHYEIAANGAVPCFRDLQRKEIRCAPHGLSDSNIISYSSYKELKEKIDGLTEVEYLKLQRGALKWVDDNSTVNKAKYIVREFLKFKNSKHFSNQDL